MCGIIGLLSNETIAARNSDNGKIIRDMLVMDSIRGKDSTGIFYDNSGEVKVQKSAVTGAEFVDMRGVYANHNLNSADFVIGHNRAATRGIVNKNNAHPFQHDHITGVHNGTLRSYHRLPDHNLFDVDSEALIYAISEIGIEAFERVTGAFAVVWHDSIEDTINLVRNDERPLHFSVVDGEKKIIISSLMGITDTIAEQHGLKIKQHYYVKPKTHVIIPTNDILNWEVNDIKFRTYAPVVVSQKKPVSVKGRDVRGNTQSTDGGDKKPTTFFATHWQAYHTGSSFGVLSGYKMNSSNTADYREVMVHNVNQAVWECLDADQACSGVVDKVVDTGLITTLVIAPRTFRYAVIGDNEDVADHSDLVMAGGGVLVPIDVYNEQVKHGCSNCSCDITADMADDIVWLNGGRDPVCQSCANELASFTKSGCH